MKKFKEAIVIFKLNVEVCPKSVNVYDRLGEAHMMNGDKELAAVVANCRGGSPWPPLD